MDPQGQKVVSDRNYDRTAATTQNRERRVKEEGATPAWFSSWIEESDEEKGSEDDYDDGIESEDERRPYRRRNESLDGYQMRARYWEAMTVLNEDLSKAVHEPEFIYDCVELPPSGRPKTKMMKEMSEYAIRRAWKRKRWLNGSNMVDRTRPDLNDPYQVVAVMMYERGQVLEGEERCSRCKHANGVSSACIIMPPDSTGRSIGDGACSNCLFYRDGDHCDSHEGPADRRKKMKMLMDFPAANSGPGKERKYKKDSKEEEEGQEWKSMKRKRVRLAMQESGSSVNGDFLAHARLVEEAAQNFADVMHRWVQKLEDFEGPGA